MSAAERDESGPISAGEGLRYFESLHHLEGKRFTPFATARELLTLLGDPQDRVPAVHVAGTNGKGTVCAILAAILRSAGADVGQTVSPHLMDVAERCLINGQPQSRDRFGAAVEHVVRVAAGAGIAPGYFVLGVLASFYEFARLELDWMVIEVGLGGAVDATNTMARPLATVITSIGLDHTELLGGTLGEIAASKAGILRAGVPVVLGELPQEAREQIDRIANAIGAPVFAAGEEFFYREVEGELVYSEGVFPLRREHLALPGRYQFRNALVAIRVALALGIHAEAIYEGLRRVRWPGRLEEFTVARSDGAPVRVLTDVCHNPDGVSALLEHLREQIGAADLKQILLLLSIVDRKDWRSMLDLFQSFNAELAASGILLRLSFTRSGSPAAVPPEQLAEYFDPSGVGCSVFGEPEAALSAAVDGASRDTLVVVAGSVFLVGRLRPALTEQPFNAIVD